MKKTKRDCYTCAARATCRLIEKKTVQFKGCPQWRPTDGK